jgi:hypothetical protein
MKEYYSQTYLIIMTESKIIILPYDLNCPALNRCGGFLRTYGVDHGADEIPTYN